MSKFRKVSQHAPFINIQVGMKVTGVIERHSAVPDSFSRNKNDTKPTVILTLTEDFHQKAVDRDGTPIKGKDKKPIVNDFKKGDSIQMDIKGGSLLIADLTAGTEIEVECTGTKDTGKKNPMWVFEIGVADGLAEGVAAE